MKSISVIALAALVGSSDAKISFGKCPEPERIANFDKARYAGQWYEQIRDTSNPWATGFECVTKEYRLNENQDLDLYFRGYASLLFSYMGIDGTMYECGTSSEGTCMATMGTSEKRSPLNVYATDYDSYEVYYKCMDILGFSKMELFNVYTREQVMSAETEAKVRQVVSEKIPQFSDFNNWLLVSRPKQGGSCNYEWTF